MNAYFFMIKLSCNMHFGMTENTFQSKIKACKKIYILFLIHHHKDDIYVLFALKANYCAHVLFHLQSFGDCSRRVNIVT